jgi:intracellular multiplication protein IcmK
MIVSRAAILATAFALLAGRPALAQAPEGGPAVAAPRATLPQPPPLAPGAPIPGQAVGPGGLPPGAVVVPQNAVPPGAVIVQQGSGQGGGKPPPPRELTPAEIQALQREMTARGAAAILTPGNIGEIRDRVLDAQGASTLPGYSDQPPPEPRARVVTFAGEIARLPPAQLYLAMGVVTPITFLDERNRPWPVASVAYDPRSFAQDGAGCGGQVQAATPASTGGERPTTINLMPCRVQTWGNVSIQLENLPVPLVFMIRSGGRDGFVDVPVTVKVRGRSPTTPIRPVEAAAAASPVRFAAAASLNAKGMEPDAIGRVKPDRMLDDFGTGVPPKGARRVRVDSPGVSAWMFNGRLYLRGPITVVNPAHDAVADAPGGHRVWRFDQPVSRVLVVGEDGVERGLSLDL